MPDMGGLSDYDAHSSLYYQLPAESMTYSNQPPYSLDLSLDHLSFPEGLEVSLNNQYPTHPSLSLPPDMMALINHYEASGSGAFAV